MTPIAYIRRIERQFLKVIASQALRKAPLPAPVGKASRGSRASGMPETTRAVIPALQLGSGKWNDRVSYECDAELSFVILHLRKHFFHV